MSKFFFTTRNDGIYKVMNNSILIHLKNKTKKNFILKKIDIQKKDFVTLSGIFFLIKIFLRIIFLMIMHIKKFLMKISILVDMH